MKICGVIAEFNPLHNGHKYLIDIAKKHSDAVVLALSGSFVQRGEPAFISKWDRTRLALECGCDLCLELPVPWSMSAAANFAFGAVGLLLNAGIDTLVFGSECGDIDLLLKTADILESNSFNETVKANLSDGKTFAAARQSAMDNTDPACSALLQSANDTLALEYILAARKLKADIDFLAVKRIGAAHDSCVSDSTVSASFIRQNRAFSPDVMPEFAASLLSELDSKGHITDYKKLDTAMLSVLRQKQAADFSNLPDISEGLENSLYKAVKTAGSLEELIFSVKSKRYTLARIRRLCMSAFLGIDNSFYFKQVPYIRPLGFNKLGEDILKSAANSGVPILSKASNAENLNVLAQSAFKAEQRATDMFALTLKSPLPAGLDYTQKIIKL
ncbi:MAG: nucleotidyltransferase family protein [Clostridia bacterium]|nr:nucleotidyltransferase family protein [Clostridia bacterium]